MKDINLHIEFVKNSENWNKCSFKYMHIAKKILEEVVNTIPHNIKTKNLELTLNLTDDSQQHSLNKGFRGNDKTTNVLSFPSQDLNYEANKIIIDDEYLGDISLSYSQIDREAQDSRITFKNHYAHLIAHGILHLLGYDHDNETQANNMESLEVKILSKLYIENPYD